MRSFLYARVHFLYLYGKTFDLYTIGPPSAVEGCIKFTYLYLGLDCARPDRCMNSTKIWTSSFFVSVILFACYSCAGGKDTGYSFEQEPPFTLGAVYYQDWVAGVREGGSGTHVHITIDSYAEDVVILDIFFSNKKEKAQNSPQYIDQYVGYFKNEARPDIVMDGDPVKEAQNTPPEAFPFQLKNNEAVLSYLHKDEVKYVKISNMERKPMLAYPSARNDEN